MKIDLKGDKFKSEIEKKSQAIYDVLESECTKTGIDAIRELRDRIVHRDFIKAIRSSDNKHKYETSYFWLDDVSYNLFAKAGLKNSSVKIKAGDDVFVDMLDFIYFLEGVVVEITNKILRIIADEIYEAREVYSIWELLEISVEPYVL